MFPNSEFSAAEKDEIEELSGKLSKQDEENKLMNSVIENDQEMVEEGKVLNDAINKGAGNFTPDILFEQLVDNYSLAKQIFGDRIIRRVTGYDASYVKKNIQIPEFQRELKMRIEKNVEEMKEKGLLDEEGDVSETGLKLASLVLYTEELDHIMPKGILGERVQKKDSRYGLKEDVKEYKKGDRYRDIAIKQAVTLAIRRGHARLSKGDLKSYERQSRGQIYVVYGLDASGSMKGQKLEVSKKAGIALAYKAIAKRDKVGLVVFGNEVKEVVEPCSDFKQLLYTIGRVRASRETDFVEMIRRAISLFPRKDVTKHLLILTDAMPTVGERPEQETLEAVAMARNRGITISVVGIKLEKRGVELGEQIASMGNGRFFVVKDLEELDRIVLEDYAGLNDG